MFTELIVRPLYNGLVGIMDLAPWAGIGVAVILFTIIVKVVLYPLSRSALLTQVRMKEVQPEADRIRAQYASDRQMQAQKTMELYRSKGVKPFAGMLLLFIQLPILWALISVFYKIIPDFDPKLLYSFVQIPMNPSPFFLGIDLAEPSIVLAILTGVIQFLQLHFSLASRNSSPAAAGSSATGMPNMAESMNKQMKYFVPLIAFASVYWIIPKTFPHSASIIALYWMTSSLMTLLQELFVRRHLQKKAA